MENKEIKEIYTRSHDENKLKLIREELQQGRCVRVNNAHETFYGFGFDSWLEKGLKDIECFIQIESYDKFERFPKCFLITPEKNR